mgnify:CR=1 FL=1
MRGFNGVVAVLAVAIIAVLAAGCGSGEASGLVKADKSAAGGELSTGSSATVIKSGLTAGRTGLSPSTKIQLRCQ